jgi:hypothetical protein
MATIKAETISIDFMKLVKKGQEDMAVLSDEQYEMIASVLEATIEEVLTDKSIVVEISRTA